MSVDPDAEARTIPQARKRRANARNRAPPAPGRGKRAFLPGGRPTRWRRRVTLCADAAQIVRYCRHRRIDPGQAICY
jgi:hypothetical protein